jgi:hypothetical protein
MTRDELQQLHGELWALRDELEPHWSTPSMLDSLRFAFTEAGEAMDAYLRTKGGYKRNHAKGPDVYGELADCALMLMTAMGNKGQHEPYDAYIVGLEWGLDYLALWVGIALDRAGRNYPSTSRSSVGAIEVCLGVIAAIPGMDMPTECRKRMDRWREKWGKHD